MKKDYASLIDFVLDDPRNKLTSMAKDLLKELSKELALPKLKTTHRSEHRHVMDVRICNKCKKDKFYLVVRTEICMKQ